MSSFPFICFLSSISKLLFERFNFFLVFIKSVVCGSRSLLLFKFSKFILKLVDSIFSKFQHHTIPLTIFMNASIEICLFLFASMRLSIYYSLYFDWISKLSRLAQRSFSTLSTLSVILLSSSRRCLYSLKAAGFEFDYTKKLSFMSLGDASTERRESSCRTE